MVRVGLTRQKLIDAAARLADDNGFGAVTLATLARQFGVRLPSLYAHVQNSEDLRRCVALLALQRLAERSEEAIAGRSGKDALVALLDAQRDFARQHPGLFEAARHPLPADVAAESEGVRLARLTRAMLRGYDLDEADSVHATRLIGAFVLGFSLLELAGSFDHSAPQILTSWQLGIDGLDALIRTWARSTPPHSKDQ